MARGSQPGRGTGGAAPKKRSSRSLAVRMRELGRTELKRQTFYALENIRGGNIWARIVGCALFALILANAVAVCVMVQEGVRTEDSKALSLFFAASTAAFFVEYLCRIWIADLAFGNCTRFQARLKYVFSPLGLIDLLSFAPSMLSWFVPVTPALVHAIGVLRLIRLVKMTRYMRGFRTIGRVFGKHYHEIVAAFLVILLLIVASSVVMYEIEHPAQPKEFDNLFAGLWWAVETVTGTGYGDIVPTTPLGRFVGGLIMLLALALVAIPGGIFSAGFVAEFQNANLRKIERDVRRTSSKASVESAGDEDAEVEDTAGAAEDGEAAGGAGDGSDAAAGVAEGDAGESGPEADRNG